MVALPGWVFAPTKGDHGMKFKSVLPYLLFGSLTFVPNGANNFRALDSSYSLHAQQVVAQKIPSTKEQIDKKAQDLCDTYIANVLQGQDNIKHAKGGHRRAVLAEFPGAIVRWYCIYGQYTQWNRAVRDLGDTLDLIPFDARHSCPEFRRLMKEKYSGPEYAGVLHNGKMFKSNKDYNNALNAFLKRNHVDENTPDSVRQKVIDRFARNNWSVESLHPGAILIIQKSNTPSNTHAVMFLGIGRMEDGNFVPDSNGKVLYAGYNNESIGDIFGTFRTDRIFAVDMLTLAEYAYTQEYQKIQDMKYNDLYQYVYDVPKDYYAIMPQRQDLQNMARAKYFNKDSFTPRQPMVRMNTASVPLIPRLNAFNLKTR